MRIFGSTCIFEQTFSVTTISKSKQDSCLSDDHLEYVLKTATSKISLEYDKLNKCCSFDK